MRAEVQSQQLSCVSNPLAYLRISASQVCVAFHSGTVGWSMCLYSRIWIFLDDPNIHSSKYPSIHSHITITQHPEVFYQMILFILFVRIFRLMLSFDVECIYGLKVGSWFGVTWLLIWRNCPISEVKFDSLQVNASWRLAGEGAGATCSNNTNTSSSNSNHRHTTVAAVEVVATIIIITKRLTTARDVVAEVVVVVVEEEEAEEVLILFPSSYFLQLTNEAAKHVVSSPPRRHVSLNMSWYRYYSVVTSR